MPYSASGMGQLLHKGGCPKEQMVAPRDARHADELKAKGCAPFTFGPTERQVFCCGPKLSEKKVELQLRPGVPLQVGPLKPQPSFRNGQGPVDPAEVVVTEETFPEPTGVERVVNWVRDHPMLALGGVAVIVGGVYYMKRGDIAYATTRRA